MSISAESVSDLESQVRANSLGLVVLSIDLYLYKAHIAQRRWGTPGGNDVAQEHYQYIQTLLLRTRWPAELEPAASALAKRIANYRMILKAKDVTRASFEATRMAEEFRTLQAGLVQLAA